MNNKSEHINELAKALSSLQGEIKDAQRDKTAGGDRFGYKYADLSQVLEIVRPLLSKYELAVTQLCGSADENVCVETVLMHSSGQWISSIIEMPVEREKIRTKDGQERNKMSHAQEVGNVITYARRYSLAAIIGITQADNDAARQQEDNPLYAEKVSVKKLNHKEPLLTPSQLQVINNLVKNNETKKEKILYYYKVNKLEDLPASSYNLILERLGAHKVPLANFSPEEIQDLLEKNHAALNSSSIADKKVS